MPLVLNFHGYTGDADGQMWYGDFRSIADTAGFIVAHPQGTLLDGATHWNVGGWTTSSRVDDVGFTERMLEHIAEVYNIDSTRVYSTGMSNGGYMSYLLACQLSERIAAVASVTGSMTPETYRDCTPQHPTPILQVHGTSDRVVPYGGASWSRSIDDVLAFWTAHNNLDEPAVTLDVPNIESTDGSAVQHVIYSNREVAVEHFRVLGGGHTWPGAPVRDNQTNQDINASVEIWKFFKRYDLVSLSQ